MASATEEKKQRPRKRVQPTAIIEVPLGEWLGPNNASFHIDVKLSAEQSLALRRAFVALSERKAICSTQRHRKLVDTPLDAVRWLLDQIAQTATIRDDP